MQKFKEFSTPEEINAWVAKHYSNITLEYFDLNKQPLFSPLSLYTGSISSRINTSLRAGALSDSFSHFEGLQFDLCQNTLLESVTTWRYVTLQEMLLLWWKTAFSRVYINPAFVSTTLLRDLFSGQARSNGFVIRINAPKGTPGMYIAELNNAAVAEYEVLFAHHLAFKRTAPCTYEIIPELPEPKYRGTYVDKSDYYQP